MRAQSGVSLLTAPLPAGCSTIAGLRDGDHTRKSNDEQAEQFRQPGEVTIPAP